VPIPLLPGPLQALSWALPFRWWFAFPVELLMGRLGSDQALVGFVMQLFWALVVFAIWRATWARAVRQYTAVGA
jgi:ABC-2 type transport system permease protein